MSERVNDKNKPAPADKAAENYAENTAGKSGADKNAATPVAKAKAEAAVPALGPLGMLR